MRSGWMRNTSFRALGLATLLVVGLSFVSGCSLFKKKSPDTGEEAPVLVEPDVSEANLPATSSLGQFEETGTVVSGGEFQDVNFAFDSVDLDSSGREVVAANARLLSASTDTRVEIEGHCDERGTSQYNLALGARRAKVVRDGLIAEGIAASRLSTVSYGEELPLCKDSTEDCWAQNRRGHLVDLTQ